MPAHISHHISNTVCDQHLNLKQSHTKRQEHKSALLYLVIVIKVPDSHTCHGDTSANGLLPDYRPVNLHGLKTGI